jgi:membrane protease YdiL (CAAX protease family)
MDKKQRYKLMRRDFNPVGFSMLAYFMLMLVCVFLVSIVDGMIMSIQMMMGNMTEEEMLSGMSSNGWGYLLYIGLGFLFLWLWKGKSFCTQTLFKRGKPMTVGDFFCLLSVFMGGQMLFSMLASVQEAILNLFGLSAMKMLESATGNAESLSMFLYMAFGAPIAEEIFCRGMVLRPMEKYGKRFAIFMSAFFFGLLHGNVVQTPFAFVVGLVLGYVAVEYNILWAMVLHMINNLVLGDMIGRLFGQSVGDVISSLLIIGFTVAGIIILILRGKETRAYVKENKIDNEAVYCFFTSPGVIICASVLFGFMVSTFVTMQ